VTEGYVIFKDDTQAPFALDYDNFQKLYRTGRYNDRPIKEVIVTNKHSDKGPNRIIFS
jgi:hypothetical protein